MNAPLSPLVARHAPASPMEGPLRVIAVLTCFNRRNQTLSCLAALAVTAKQAQVKLEVILVDDASTDGTSAAVAAQFPWVEVIKGSGNLFWSRGMHVGFGLALQRTADYYLWLNDDTHLVPEALGALLRNAAALAALHRTPAIVVGATADRAGGAVTYGGRVVHTRLRPFNYQLVWDQNEPVACDVMEGNCVLIPNEVAQRVGNLDPIFEHAMGDTDYSLRARRAGFRLFVAPGTMGYCSCNAVDGTYYDTSLPLRTRWKLIRSRKGLPVRSWLHFTRRHGGWLWPLYFAYPYLKLPVSATRAFMSRRAAVPST